MLHDQKLEQAADTSNIEIAVMRRLCSAGLLVNPYPLASTL